MLLIFFLPRRRKRKKKVFVWNGFSGEKKMVSIETKAARLREIGYNVPGLSVEQMYDLARYQGRIKDEQTAQELAAAPSYSSEQATRSFPWRRVASAAGGSFVW